jgi:hypothetical protein
MGLAHLERLRRIRGLLTAQGRPGAATARLLCFSGAGFSAELRDEAAQSGEVRLLTAADLYIGILLPGIVMHLSSVQDDSDSRNWRDCDYRLGDERNTFHELEFNHFTPQKPCSFPGGQRQTSGTHCGRAGSWWPRNGGPTPGRRRKRLRHSTSRLRSAATVGSPRCHGNPESATVAPRPFGIKCLFLRQLLCDLPGVARGVGEGRCAPAPRPVDRAVEQGHGKVVK